MFAVVVLTKLVGCSVNRVGLLTNDACEAQWLKEAQLSKEFGDAYRNSVYTGNEGVA